MDVTLSISETVDCSSEGVRESKLLKLDGLLLGLSWKHKHFMKSNLKVLAMQALIQYSSYTAFNV